MKSGLSVAGRWLAGSVLVLALCAQSSRADHVSVVAEDPALSFVHQLDVYQPRTRLQGTLTLWGHGSHKRNFMGRLVARWRHEFVQYHPDVRVTNRMYGTASAVGALYTGAGDIALLGEEISPAARAAFLRAKGYPPTEFTVATGSLDVNYFDYAHMIFVHQSNPIRGLSLEQLARIFGTSGPDSNVRGWGALGLDGEWAGRPIQPYGWKVDVDFALFFSERVMHGSHRWNPAILEFTHSHRPDGRQIDHGQRILDALAGDITGIGISNIRYQVKGVRVVPLAWTDDGPWVLPSTSTLIDQSYPLVRLIPAVIDRPPGQPIKPLVQAFLSYILSRQGQTALIEETGYLPVGEQFIRSEREDLQ